MSPEIWGKYGWNFIHLVTLGYPDNPIESDKKHYYDFFSSLQYVLPCAKCRHNFSQHFRKYPLTSEILANRRNLVRWGIDLHNVVNYYNGKPMLTYPEAMNEINKMLETKNNFENMVYYLLVVIAILIICFFLYRYLKEKKIE
jgi:hypothetical protein